tara:strand:- start:9508 stop:9963 length:456 start_codon:yes stop_codon:yes gene_type:complete
MCKKKDDNYLDDIEWKDTQPFVVPIKSGKVIKVYDGDTITIANKLPIKDSPVYRFSVRLNGIDTPEIKSKEEAEKELAKKARDFLSEKILGKNVELKDVKSEKYGRILATVYYNHQDMNQMMIDNGHAQPYDGGTKHIPDAWKDSTIKVSV